ncbi:MAG: polymer-forming cytoskeletal protein [Thermoanaerobaculales bacterium]|jgi:cytoskeletal protein CcmA (bactofilin family)|nr:polymer-forming cytoskeletal protein [Thermoanaerobaculales bacterium]
MVRGPETLNGFIDSGCTLRGELEFSSSFRIDGRVEGTIRSRSELLIGEDGAVEGEIDVARCLIGGQVRGTVKASERVVLHASAKVWGELHAPAIVMEDGAFLEGRVEMAAPVAPPVSGTSGPKA